MLGLDTEIKRLASLSSTNDLRIPAYSVRLTLEACKENLTSTYYNRFLKEAGLERFADKIPESTAEAVATITEISTFMGKIFSVTRESVFPLFCRNIATSTANLCFKSPYFQAVKEQTLPYFKDETHTPEEKMAKYAELVTALLPPKNLTTLIADKGNLFSITPNCYNCSAIENHNLPCYINNIFLELSFKWLTGQSCTIEQTHSVTRGDLACVQKHTLVTVGFR